MAKINNLKVGDGVYKYNGYGRMDTGYVEKQTSWYTVLDFYWYKQYCLNFLPDVFSICLNNKHNK